MGKDKMINVNVTLGDVQKRLKVDGGITLSEILAKVTGDNKENIIATDNTESKVYVVAKVNKKLRELTNRVNFDADIEFMKVDSPVGFDIYKRSLILLMLKSVNDVMGDYKVEIMYSLGSGFFCKISDVTETTSDNKGSFIMSQELLDSIKARMAELVKQDVKITKKTIATRDARDEFMKRGLSGKAGALRYRRASKTNVYCIEDYEDYFYGYMVPSTGCLTKFDLKAYDDGFVLVIPDKKTFEVPDYKAPDKLYATLRKSEDWGRKLKLSGVGELNDVIVSGGMNDLILVQEALMEKQLADVAQQIVDGGKKIVLIAGPSSSGKTTTSNRLSIQLKTHGLRPHPIAMDNFFVERVDNPKDEDGNYDFECIEAVDLKLFNETMAGLLEGKEMPMPTFDFAAGIKVYDGTTLKLEEGDVLVVEGIHALNPLSSEALPADKNYKIYISALTQLNLDEHNRISTTDTRLLRRIVRDARTRGNSATKTISMWPSVRRGEEKNIFPYQEEADAMFNSALIYELAAIKQFAEPLLFGVPEDSEEYYEARRLLKFLDYFLGIDVTSIPQNSLMREFIGGGCFKV